MAEKKYITLKSPKSVGSSATKAELKKLFEAGVKPSEISLRLEFVASDATIKSVVDKFRILSNRVLFELWSKK